MSYRIAYIGNFEPPHSTENEVRKALEHLGHEVRQFQESGQNGLAFLEPEDFDFILWTHTHQFCKMNAPWSQHQMLRKARRVKTPVIGYHLDRWWGLDRQDLIYHDPFFDVDLLCTADGGHPQDWAYIGVDHEWFPPAVSEFECEPGTYNSEYASDLAFIGGWEQYGHREATHRPALINFLKENYAGRVKFWPYPGQPAIRGEKLRDVIASTKIVVGDSCITDWENECCYWSDRIPETIGRGGYLAHPLVGGISPDYEPGVHFATWDAFDWDGLRLILDSVLDDFDEDTERNHYDFRTTAQQHVLENHTYTVRMKQLIELLQEREMV